MSITDCLNPLFSLTARACERSPIVSEMIRGINFKGKGRIVERLRPELMNREVVSTCDGLRYQLYLGDDVQRELYFNIYERRDLRMALDLIPVGGVCIDVGANNGAFALQFARKVGKLGLVHAFEPDPRVFPRLQTNCALNCFQDYMKCHQLAVSNLTGRLPFYQSDLGHSGWGSLAEFKDIAVGREYIEAVTMDHFLARENIHSVDFLKVDVEAHEPELLEGARDSLLKQLFRFILIEFNGIRLAQLGKSLDSYLVPLLGAGYRPLKPLARELEVIKNDLEAQRLLCTNMLFTAE